MTSALMVVDMQNGFMKRGCPQLIPKIQQLVIADYFNLILFSRHINLVNGPFDKFLNDRKMYGGVEIEIVEGLSTYAQNIIDKGGYSAVTIELLGQLQKSTINEVVLVGVETESCILKSALDLFEYGYKVVVLSDCCNSGRSEYLHRIGLEVIAKNLGPDSVVTSSDYFSLAGGSLSL